MPSLFCATCVDYLLTSQWQKYVDQLAKASCKAEQRRLLDKGPPINISVSSYFLHQTFLDVITSKLRYVLSSTS
jgi:hypothetical protein